jgi:hypothetical protein
MIITAYAGEFMQENSELHARRRFDYTERRQITRSNRRGGARAAKAARCVL